MFNVIEQSRKNKKYILITITARYFSMTIIFSAPPVPPRSFENTPAVGTKLEGLLLNELEHDNDFDPRSFENNHNTQFYPSTNGTTSSPPLSKYLQAIP